uniref:Putative salivary kunitz domain protein n=1 Tax=Ixodes ricinus TaxID=34613 RepID=A0A0K8RG19_IXORI
MFIHVVWILATATTGSYSQSCQSDYKVDVCFLDPVKGEGDPPVQHFFYDWRTGTCLSMMFGNLWDQNEEQNRFHSEDDCNSKCRKGLRNECFEEVWEGWGNRRIEKGAYNSSSMKCVRIFWSGNEKVKNLFNSEDECSEKCKIPDLGPCAYPFRTDCRHGDSIYYSYNNKTQKCVKLHPHQCPTYGNGFYTMRQCYQRCGRFVENKCELPIQNMSFCGTPQRRYGYNTKTERCEMFLGCEDSGNNFRTPQACWETCAKPSKHRCTQRPDYYTTIGPVKRYYYSINSHECKSSRMILGRVSGTSNLFYKKEECEDTCRSTYKPDSDDWE